VSHVCESLALDIVHLLEEKGALVEYHEPHLAALQYGGVEMSLAADLEAALVAADCEVVATDHGWYDLAIVIRAAKLAVDI
jgi:UDP-N-acetyl-D-glucosamine dehydrogenase